MFEALNRCKHFINVDDVEIPISQFGRNTNLPFFLTFLERNGRNTSINYICWSKGYIFKKKNSLKLLNNTSSIVLFFLCILTYFDRHIAYCMFNVSYSPFRILLHSINVVSELDFEWFLTFKCFIMDSLLNTESIYIFIFMFSY